MNDKHISNKSITYGGGKAGIGCGVILGLFIAAFIIIRVMYFELPVLGMVFIGISCSIIFGYFGGKYGNKIFERVLKVLPWI